MPYVKVTMVLLALLAAGCSSKQPGPDEYGSVADALSKNIENDVEYDTVPYQTQIKPYVGTRQNDAKVVLDMGRVLKVWVAPYKQKGTLIADHDIYSIVQKPDFIVGEMIPSGKKTSGLTACDNDFPFVFKDSNIETVEPAKRFEDENIKSYVDNVYKAQKDPKYYDKKRSEAGRRYDDTIRDYLK